LELDTTTAQEALLHKTAATNFYQFQVSNEPSVLPLTEQIRKRRKIESFDVGHCKFQVGNQFQAHNRTLFCEAFFQYD